MAESLLQSINTAIQDIKGKDFTFIDTHEQTPFFDWIIIVSGTSSRHVRAIADAVVVAGKQHCSVMPKLEGQRDGEWLLVDFVAGVVHIMSNEAREYYQLERLWQPIRMSKETQ